MHPKIRSFWLLMALALLLLAGLSIGHLSPLGSSIALGQSSDNSSRKAEANRLLKQGIQQLKVSQFQAAFQSWQQALAIYKEIGDRKGEGNALGNLGLVYYLLGNYTKAIELQQQSLTIARGIRDRPGEGQSLGMLGDAYYSLGNYSKAFEFHQKALAIHKEIGNKSGEASSLIGLGLVYQAIRAYGEAINYYYQSLEISQKIADRYTEARALASLGYVSSSIGALHQAIVFNLKFLALSREIRDRNFEAIGLNNLANSLANQRQTSLAIVFYKQAINVLESIRKDLRLLPKEQQKSYVETFSVSYRNLANLLLRGNRVLEAQQVLDLLKVQELQDYLRTVRGNATTAKGLYILQPEQQILAKYNTIQNSAIQLGQELSKLRQVPEPSRTSAQQQRIAQLIQLEEDLNRQFNDFARSPDVAGYLKQLTFEIQQQTVSLADLDALRDNLRRLNAVLLYPLILPDRLELIITTPDAAPLRRTVQVSSSELNKTILEFRQQMQTCETKPCTKTDTEQVKAISQKLYNWLIKPLEADLKQANAQSILYAPDGQLRYLPLAALHDGNQWLTQRLRINNITAKSLDNLEPQSSKPPLKVLAGAFTQGRYQFSIGPQQFDFGGLPFAKKEIAQLVAAVPSTTPFLDQAFSLAAIKPRMNEYSVLHLATHAAFLPGQPENSFILFGNGDRATLRDIENWTLNNIDMVILSACETGLGLKLGDGVEILGLGYQFQNRGVRSTIASLWQVNDESTQILMNTLYAQLKKGNTPTAEALRQAQLTLMQSKGSGSGQTKGSISVQPKEGTNLPSQPIDYNHPYYWAPFILIGNGL
jgi:CHAT domain-containing protein